MKNRGFSPLCGVVMVLVAMSLWAHSANAQFISGDVLNQSSWSNGPALAPPGNGSGSGTIYVGMWAAGSLTLGTPAYSASLSSTPTLPFAYGSLHPFTIGATNGSFGVVAWIDGNGNGAHEEGEPVSTPYTAELSSNAPVINGILLTITDDVDGDTMADWWEVHWFGDLKKDGTSDHDNDGLTDAEEYALSRNPALAMLSPVNWDSDGDLMDDGWEYQHYAFGTGTDPVTADGGQDVDGDGLLNLQEYNGVDGIPLRELDRAATRPGAIARLTGSMDDLNPLDVDTDGDTLVDSFEAAWYDPTEGIDPKSAGNAGADPDQDGLTNYREMSLLAEFREYGSNDVWSAGSAALPIKDINGLRQFIPHLALGSSMNTIYGDIAQLRGQEWTDPTEGTGYIEGLPAGHDTDDDDLPDGWELEFNLNPRSGESLIFTNSLWEINPSGFWGDPDNDGLINTEEYAGQDGNRSSTKTFINGTGDETNPNEHNWRPMSTGIGPGTSRPFNATNYWSKNAVPPGSGSLGAALPTASLGADNGNDSDEDGIPDSIEMWAPILGLGEGSSPVHSTDPFIRRSALITSSSGTIIPDPEGLTNGYSPLLHARDWTLECQVKIMGTNCSGYLINNVKPTLGGNLVYRMELVHNVPVVSFHRVGGTFPVYSVSGLTLPTNQWIHLAGVWSHSSNSLALYVNGIFVQEQLVYQEALSQRFFSSPIPITIGANADGSFVNTLYIDEIRIWGVARNATDIETYRTILVPQNAPGLLAYYRFDDGGATAEDFARKAQNGLLAATSSEYLFGDFGYALATNYFRFVTNDVADVRGVDGRGSDDSDGDGMPDAWEMIHHLSPYSAEGNDGANGDPDLDDLVNIYEYWSHNNPKARDSDQDARLDSDEDYDGDLVSNLTEQDLGSRPDIKDTDDDGYTDNEEQGASTDPANAVDPSISRAAIFGGSANDYLSIPISFTQPLRSWSLELWVNPTNAVDGAGILLRRTVQEIGGGNYAVNYIIGLETNGAALQPYAGYVMPDGTPYIIHGKPLEVGKWTHLAATYNNKSATLTILTNTVPSVQTNKFFVAPPANGKGGGTFVRTGEDFAGQIDEIRIWNFARTSVDIASDYRRIFDTVPTGLIHYFRFDDGQANTTQFAFDTFHAPQGAQDFTWLKDWNNQWVHAARFHGASDFIQPGAFIPPPSLRAILNPEQARIEGALWAIDGGIWRNSGDTVYNLSEGSHTVSYKTIPGWTSPTNETMALTNGMAITITRTYLQNGSLQVFLDPPSATGAQWRVDGGSWYDSGTVASNLTVGPHLLDYKTLVGWDSPTSEVYTISEGSADVITRTYILGLADLSITLEPPAARTDGAQWRIDGGAWQDSGVTNSVRSGPHTISYKDLAVWITPTNELITIVSGVPVSLTRYYALNLVLDADKDGLLDSWEIHWFGDLSHPPDEDYDKDGLSNKQEHDLYTYRGMTNLDPAQFDSDGDGMDDKWEYDHYARGTGLNPDIDDGDGDTDGDGLSNVQEYMGIDGKPRLEQDPEQAAGIAVAAAASTDDLNPLDFDTDHDGLVDSFEAAWYDPVNKIDPRSAEGADLASDQDKDGLTAYREQCLLPSFAEGGDNDVWSNGTNDFPAIDANGLRALSTPLLLGATNSIWIGYTTVMALRTNAWTDPSHGSGYEFDYPLDGSDGWDTDGDLLPDGWEVEFNLDPQSGAAVLWNGFFWEINDNGYYGDPDVDGLLNFQEYEGQDGNRSETDPHINGTGDETNPNEHNWRLDSTGAGPGTKRPWISLNYWNIANASPSNGTLGGARPTISKGYDWGLDSDDDGIQDNIEIQGVEPTSPVHSMSPFVRQAALVTSTNGISVPDPEGDPVRGYSPLLHARDWTLECMVKTLGTNCTGYLINNPGPFGSFDITFRLALSNNIPIVSFHTIGGSYYAVQGLAIPSNKWTHVAAVWSHSENYLALYIDGVFDQGMRIMEEALAGHMYASANPVTIGVNPDGSFVNRLMIDEVRIWGIRRSSQQIDDYRQRLIPPASSNLLAYYRFDDGGTTAEDFSRKAKNGLTGAASQNYTFGDFGYALPTNGFTFISNDFAKVDGVDITGADDSDGDGMPDDWEMINHLDPNSAEGFNGANGDPDGDTLVNIYEYWSDTNPFFEDTDRNGILDAQEDRDGDKLKNGVEQSVGSRPNILDTDDDGISDGLEVKNGTSPINSVDPTVSRAMSFGGTATDYLDIPVHIDQRLTTWSLEAWVNPSNTAGGLIVGRALQRQADGTMAMNYTLGLLSNGGTLLPYAGYVSVDGNTNILFGPSIPAGSWTHLAATYNYTAGTIALYTNGALCATTNTFSDMPLLNGKAGEAYLRIGQGFFGLIDDVRIWKAVRSSGDIRANYLRAVDATLSDLLIYFRFDDRQASTNEFPFGRFHQPWGAQDFKYPQDWTNEWRHAALLNGNTFFSADGTGAIIPPPTLRINLLPAQVLALGAQWSVDGGPWYYSGELAENLEPGLHTVTYLPINGWTAPSNEYVTVTNGYASVLTRTYVENGRLKVTLQPVGAISAGALWRVDGGMWMSSGQVVSNLTVGTHMVDYQTATNWIEPTSQTVTINEGAETSIIGVYMPVTGTIQMFIEPPVAIAAGAAWNIDGGAWQTSGTAVSNIPLGSHSVVFSNVPPWITPASKSILLTNAVPVVGTGVYTMVSGIFVIIHPSAAVSSGAQWRVDGGVWTNSGTFIELPAGTYTVDFKTINSWVTPNSASVIVSNQITTMLMVHYFQYQVLSSIGSGDLPGQFIKPASVAYDSLHRLYVSDSEHDRIQRYDPANRSWTVWGSVTNGTAVGQFNQPLGLTLDSANNLYVADALNNRIQRRDATTGMWTNFGTPGSGIGQFNAPYDVAIDGGINMYVADSGNLRVQKRTSSGTWSIIISNGFSDGLVRAPRGLTFSASGDLVVSDHYISANYSRIQSFTPGGVFVSRLGGTTNTEGGFNQPWGMTFGTNGELLVADTQNSRITSATSFPGGWTTLINSNTLNRPYDVTLDPHGYLCIADTYNNRVILVTLPTSEVHPAIGAAITPSSPTNGFAISWNGVAGWLYDVQYVNSLTNVNGWMDVPGCVKIPGSNGVMRCVDTTSIGLSVRYYRLLAY